MPVTSRQLGNDLVEVTLSAGCVTAKIINYGATLTHLLVENEKRGV